jgi:tRNA pseudouridine38-40 synthase
VRAYRIAYDGRPFYGFQRQPSVPTVEDAVLEALADLGVTDGPGTVPPGYAAAGRTDRGVSALAQTVAFDAPAWLSPRALNGELPDDVRAWASAAAPAEFHATADAAWRAYEYHLHAPADRVDDDRARAALERLEGTHDFGDLSATSDGNAVRSVTAVACERDGEYLALRVRAEGFLHEMVRRMATLVDLAGRGELALPVADYLEGAGHSGPAGIGPAPAEGLVLAGVGYPDLSFERDPDALADCRSVFERRRVRATTRARVAGTIAEEFE